MQKNEAQPVLSIPEWTASLQNLHIPRWQELPDMGLYMDQVVAYLEQQLEPLARPGETLITPSMVNNYVKQGLLPKPEKKKYGRLQIALLVTISFFKPISSLTEISVGLRILRRDLNAEQLYDLFCEQQENSLRRAAQLLQSLQSASSIESEPHIVTIATDAAAGWIAAKALLLQPQNQE